MSGSGTVMVPWWQIGAQKTEREWMFTEEAEITDVSLHA